MDLFLCLLAVPLFVPLTIFVAILVRLDSSGRVMFSHRRLGHGGRDIWVRKFRTMYADSDSRLHELLSNCPESRLEWEQTHKLKNDPRVTRVGRVLRRLSLDELPQLLNVLEGTMSLVGPRPIVDAEICRYGPRYRFYTQVRPGLTGLWQVSGRNHTTYRRRVALDVHYVKNRSLTLDLAILARTVRVVVFGIGAY